MYLDLVQVGIRYVLMKIVNCISYRSCTERHPIGLYFRLVLLKVQRCVRLVLELLHQVLGQIILYLGGIILFVLSGVSDAGI